MQLRLRQLERTIGRRTWMQRQGKTRRGPCRHGAKAYSLGRLSASGWPSQCPAFHPKWAAFHPKGTAFHPKGPAFHPKGPAFHPKWPAFHPKWMETPGLTTVNTRDARQGIRRLQGAR